MKLIGEKIFAKDAAGYPLSRIGTLFFHTPGLVTRKGVHAFQRMMWIDDLNATRAAAGQPPLTEEEENVELQESVDLIFTADQVLIRPDPERMDLAMRADEVLQTLVSKREIRFLNTNALKVRRALGARGENWRMARAPISQDDMVDLINASRVPIGERPIYFYNRATGTRYVTASSYDEVEQLPAPDFRRQIEEIVTGLTKRNRLGQPEIDLFPLTTPPEIKRALRTLKVADLSDADLKKACRAIDTEWRVSLPPELRDERTENFDWRNTMCDVITRQPNETNAEEQELIAGISPEFYRQIEWLPGARIDKGEVVFDPIYDEATRTQDPELLALCDARVKSIIFNMTRLNGELEFINVGRIAHSLARRPVKGSRRGNVYILQYKLAGQPDLCVRILRLQKWGVTERLDEGKGLLQAIVESDEYADYILDRRLMCRQLGMNLPTSLNYGHFTERYHGSAGYTGCSVRTSYFVRDYIRGIASDKVPPAKFHNPAFARRFAELMGEAAALDLIVGRRSSVTREPLFDQNYEVIQLGADGLPAHLIVTDQAGSFTSYEEDYLSYIDIYAQAVIRRRAFVGAEYAMFANAYVEAFRRRLTEVQSAYRSRRRAFDELFADRPYDTNGSGAFRWACALKRLDAAHPDQVAAALAHAIG